MTIFRWIIGGFAALFALGSVLSFVLFMAFDIEVWLQRARMFRHWLYLVLLLWFNVEIWGRVVLTIIHW
jgi:hypothetical protein